MRVAGVLAVFANISGAHADIDLTGIHGFDFLVGEWRVHHRRISAVSRMAFIAPSGCARNSKQDQWSSRTARKSSAGCSGRP
jgi:hypothetical protein